MADTNHTTSNLVNLHAEHPPTTLCPVAEKPARRPRRRRRRGARAVLDPWDRVERGVVA